MRALVTGGAGLIGSHIADLLDKEGFVLRILDNLDEGTHPKPPGWIKKNYEFIQGDIRDKSKVRKSLAGVDYVFHQAAYGGFTWEIGKYIATNSLGTANIFEVIQEKRLKLKKLVVASSQAIYGEGKYLCSKHGVQEPSLRSLPQLKNGEWEVKCGRCQRNLTPVVTDEGKCPDPGTVYAVTKYTQERMVLRLGQALGIPTVALRYATTFGPRQSLFNPYTGVVSIFSTRILNGLPPVIYEDGAQTRDFVYVEDVARANFFVSQNPKADYQVFNVSTGRPVTILGLVDLLNRSYAKDIRPTLPGEFRQGEVRHLILDNTKLKKLGWRPKTTLEEGIAKYVDWIRSQGTIEEYFGKALKMMQKRGVVLKAKK